MKKLTLLLVCTLFTGFALLLFFLFHKFAPSTLASVEVPSQSPIFVIDPGHGGEDGGAVSRSGTIESHLNLDIALKLEQCLALYGHAPFLLRREDISLHSESADTLREKKSSDLHQRVALVETIENAILISIHQNSFPQTQYHGAQVFYAPTEGSQALAQELQRALRGCLDQENNREVKLIPNTIYLMNHISCPAVLVECGFLTNPQEAELLRTQLYQKKLAATLALTLHNTRVC